MALDSFTPATRSWFAGAFSDATRIQRLGWPAIQQGRNVLLVAPTGSGKTLAAFLWSLDSLQRLPADAEPGTRIVYVSPLKALAYDVERNLRSPLVGIRRAAELAGDSCRDVQVDVRTGDTPQKERERMRRRPGEILVTTPESLFLMLGSRARENFRGVHTVIVDEVHALAPTKRGVHLALSLERLEEIADGDVQRIGLSATVRPAGEVARFLAGKRPVDVIDAAEPPNLDLSVRIPEITALPKPAATDDEPKSVLGQVYKAERPLDRRSRDDDEDESGGLASALHVELLELIRGHRSTIVFVNSRGQCERLAQRLNELAEEELVSAHHGSVSQARRKEIEEALKRGEVKGIVATSSLELGVDMGSVDLVVLVESPGAVARGLQRVGRAGHSVGATSQGVILPKLRGDLLECAVISARMQTGELEAVRTPTRCLDVLAQQIVAMVCDEPRSVDDIERVVQSAYPYRDLSRALLTAVLDMLTGRYPSDQLADLRPRLSWDRTRDRLTPRRGTAMISRLNAGTIPDRGMFGVHLGEGGPRIGELDEEMVFETRSGDVILLGSSSWRVLEITRDRVFVEPAPGEPGRLPFWRGDGPGRPVELGRAIGELLRRLEGADLEEMHGELQRTTPLDATAARRLAEHVHEQVEHAGFVPTDRRIVVERFRDEVGDWRICVLTPFGGRVHAPWAMALRTLLSERCGFEIVSTYNDDGIVLTFADGDDPPDAGELFPDPGNLEQLVSDQLDGSALFGATFRENAARALLLPRRNPRARSPLWAQRLRAKNLMASVLKHEEFPIVLETYRHCMRDVFDLPSLAELLTAVRNRSVKVEAVETRSASPFARALVFAHVANYLYEQDAPLAERRTQALRLDQSLLRELLGDVGLRDLLSPDVVESVEQELQALVRERRARDPDELHDLLRALGALSVDELGRRSESDPTPWLEDLEGQRRAIELKVAGETRWAAAHDAGLYRDALGVMPPAGLPEDFLCRIDDALPQLVRRFARCRGPFTVEELAREFAISATAIAPVLAELERAGSLVAGEMRRPEPEWCDADVLRRIKRETLARMRREIAPVDDVALSRFTLSWHGVAPAEDEQEDRREASAQLLDVVARLEGLALPWSEWETAILPARVRGFSRDALDLLSASGQIVWVGRGALGTKDGRVALYRRETVPLLLDIPTAADDLDDLPRAILSQLEQQGASFAGGLRGSDGERLDVETLESALWDLVWAGLVTNDTFGPLRQLGARFRRRSRTTSVTGRWSLVRELADESSEPTARAHARASMLLERYGVVGRAAAQFEELRGGFASIYDVLRAMEDAGRSRRGHFVEGLEGAQFALPLAVDELRAARDPARGEPRAVVLSAVDPASPWGSILQWPETDPAVARPRRVAGARVVLVDGSPVLYSGKGARSLQTFRSEIDHERMRVALRALVEAPAHRLISIERVDGVPPSDSPHRELFEECGFASGYRGFTLRESHRRA